MGGLTRIRDRRCPRAGCRLYNCTGDGETKCNLDVQPLEEIPPHFRNHSAPQAAGTFAILAEGPDKKPIFAAHVLDYQSGQIEMRPQLA